MILLSINSNSAQLVLTLKVSVFITSIIVVNSMFESIGSLKYPMVQFSNRNTYKYFNNKFKPISKIYFFGDSNNQDLILHYDFYKDIWSKKEVPKNLSLQSYSVAIGLNDGCILITGGLNSSFTNVSG
jgi:hypothetical protein